LDADAGSVLVLYSDRPHPAGWDDRPRDPVRPSDVAEWIRQSLRAGWEPEAGPQFHGRVRGGSVETVL
jgi:hypothetical protein